MAATFTVPTVFKAIDQITAPVRGIARNFKHSTRGMINSMKRASFEMNRFNKRINSVFSRIEKRLGTLGIIASFALLVTVLKRAGAAVLDYETALVGVGKTTGIENENLKLLGASIVKTSNVLKTIKTDNLLKLAEAAGQLGVKGNDNILKFAATMAKLEKASDIVGEEGAKSIARLLTITKEGPAVVDKFAASLVALGNSSAASESEILSVASEVGRATAAYSLHSKEILGISAALKSLDVAPESAGSAVGKVFREIELATLKGGESLERFSKIMKLTPKQVTKTFKDSPQKAFSLFIKGLGRIKDEGGSVAKTLIDVGLSGERVSKGIIPLATNYKLLEDKIKLSQKAFRENIALDKEFEASQKTIKSAINSIVRAYENLFITQATAGSKMEKVQNILFAIGDNLGTIFKVIGLLIGAFLAFKTIILATNIVVGVYNIALGIQVALQKKSIFALRGNMVAMKAYKIATAIGAAAQWLYNTALVPAIAATWAFTAALLANPIVWVVAAVLALIAGIYLLIKHWKEIVNWVKTSDNWFAKLIRFSLIPLIITFKIIKWVILGIIQVFKDLVNWVKTSDSGFAKFIRNGIQGLIMSFKILGHVFNKIGEAFKKVWDWIKKIAEPVKDFFKFIGNSVKVALGTLDVDVVPDIKNATGMTTQEMGATSRNLADTALKQDISINQANKEVITRNDQKEVQQQNSRLDMYINDRTKNTEIYTEGTGVNVKTTG